MYLTYGVMYGVGSSLIFTSCLLITAQYFTRWRALAITIVSGGIGAGILAFGPTTEALVDSVGWQGALRIVAGAMAFVALLGCSYDEIKKEGDTNVSVVYKTNNSGNELGFTNVTFGQQDVGANGLRRQHTDEDVQVTNGDDTITMKDSVIENGFVNGYGTQPAGSDAVNTFPHGCRVNEAFDGSEQATVTPMSKSVAKGGHEGKTMNASKKTSECNEI